MRILNVLLTFLSLLITLNYAKKLKSANTKIEVLEHLSKRKDKLIDNKSELIDEALEIIDDTFEIIKDQNTEIRMLKE